MTEDRHKVVTEAYRLGLVQVNEYGAVFAFARPGHKGTAYMAHNPAGEEQVFNTKREALDWLRDV